ncbi:unnamed protein product, partial [Owenia fusiformis]
LQVYICGAIVDRKLCGRRCESEASLRRHQESFHGVVLEVDQRKNYTCHYCGRHFDHKADVKAHARRHKKDRNYGRHSSSSAEPSFSKGRSSSSRSFQSSSVQPTKRASFSSWTTEPSLSNDRSSSSRSFQSSSVKPTKRASFSSWTAEPSLSNGRTSSSYQPGKSHKVPSVSSSSATLSATRGRPSDKQSKVLVSSSSVSASKSSVSHGRSSYPSSSIKIPKISTSKTSSKLSASLKRPSTKPHQSSSKSLSPSSPNPSKLGTSTSGQHSSSGTLELVPSKIGFIKEPIKSAATQSPSSTGKKRKVVTTDAAKSKRPKLGSKSLRVTINRLTLEDIQKATKSSEEQTLDEELNVKPQDIIQLEIPDEEISRPSGGKLLVKSSLKWKRQSYYMKGTTNSETQYQRSDVDDRRSKVLYGKGWYPAATPGDLFSTLIPDGQQFMPVDYSMKKHN